MSIGAEEADLPFEILLVEDNEADVELTRQCLAEVSAPYRLHTVSDGAEALEFLRKPGAQGCPPLPDLILLDLNLPGMHGHEVLREIKGDAALRAIPVIVLSSSNAPADVAESYALHANAFIAKPLNLYEFNRIIGAIEAFWLATAVRPGLARS